MDWQRFRKAAALSLFAVASTVAISYGAGRYVDYPQIGNPSFCSSTQTGAGALGGATGQGQAGTGSICTQTVPAGEPFLSGSELIPTDVPNQPANTSQAANVNLFTGYTGKNVLVGGDFNQNLWQRGLLPVNAVSAQVGAMAADGWVAWGINQLVTVSKVTALSDIQASADVQAAMRLAHPSANSGTQVCVAQLVPARDSGKFIGNNATLSFSAQPGPSFSATALNVDIDYYTATDSTTPFTNTATFISQSIANFTRAVSVSQTLGTAAQTATSGSYTRYSFTGTIPTTLSAGTAVTGLGVQFCYVPNSGATGIGGANDFVDLANIQLEPQLGTGNAAASRFDRRPLATEWAIEQARYYRVQEGTVSGTLYPATIVTNGANIEYIQTPFPTTMRITPSYGYAAENAAGTANLPGGFELTPVGVAASAAPVVTVSGVLAGATQNSGFVKATGTVAVTSAGMAAMMLTSSGAGTGVIEWIAEP